MKASLRNKLELLVERAEEVSALLAEGGIAANGEQYRKLSKEHAELMPVVEAWSAFRQAEADEAETGGAGVSVAAEASGPAVRVSAVTAARGSASRRAAWRAGRAVTM